MTIPALWLDIGIHVAVKTKKPVLLVTFQAGVKTLFKFAAIGSQVDAISLPNR